MNMIKRTHQQEKLFWTSAIIAILIGAVLFLYPPQATSQTSSAPMTGYAWSDTIGWISFNGPSYGVTINANGTLSGYAWSEHVGWISANASDVAGCPASPCTPDFSGGALTGWFKALAGGTAQSGAWDGFIRLSNSSSYGVTSDENGIFSGYAWGSDVVGWVSFSTAFSDVRTTYEECTPTFFCQDGDSWERNAICEETFNEDCDKGVGWSCGNGSCVPPPDPRPPAGEDALQLVPSAIQAGQTVTATWNVEYADSCAITINGVVWLQDVSASGSQVTGAINETSDFVLTCVNTEGSYDETQTVIIRPEWQEV